MQSKSFRGVRHLLVSSGEDLTADHKAARGSALGGSLTAAWNARLAQLPGDGGSGAGSGQGGEGPGSGGENAGGSDDGVGEGTGVPVVVEVPEVVEVPVKNAPVTPATPTPPIPPRPASPAAAPEVQQNEVLGAVTTRTPTPGVGAPDPGTHTAASITALAATGADGRKVLA